MTTMLAFLAKIRSQPPGIQLWIAVLVVVHGIAPWWFVDHVAGVTMGISFIGSTVSMALLFARFGYARILGLAHLVWLPAMVVLVQSWPLSATWTPLAVWGATALVTGTLSLIMDLVDVVRWVRGERVPLA